VALAHQVAAAVFDRADHVAELLVGDAGHIREPQLASREQPREPLGVALVGLDAVPGRAGHLARGDDADVDAALGRRACQPEPGRPGLIGRPDLARQRRQEPDDLRRRHPQLHAAQLAAGGVEDRRMRLRRVNVKPDQRHTVLHGRHLPELGCRRQAHPAAQSPHISARGADRSTPQAKPDRPP
jgi:hypothetical protein